MFAVMFINYQRSELGVVICEWCVVDAVSDGELDEIVLCLALYSSYISVGFVIFYSVSFSLSYL
jgi:hypothetical protein